MEQALPTPASSSPPAAGGRPDKPVFYPVIHFASTVKTLEQAELALDCGADGVFLVNMEGPSQAVDGAAAMLKRRHPSFFVGVNRLDMNAVEAVAANLALGLDGTWTDNADIRGRRLGPNGRAVFSILDLHDRSPEHAFFAGVAFKYQPHEPDPNGAAETAKRLGWIPTTSGPGTGRAADPALPNGMRSVLGDWPLAIASGITPENIESFLPSVTAYLVSTGIAVAGDEHSFDPGRVRALTHAIKARAAAAAA